MKNISDKLDLQNLNGDEIHVRRQMMINTCQIVAVAVTEEDRVKFKAIEKLDKYLNYARKMLSDIKETVFFYCGWNDYKEHRKSDCRRNA